MRSARWIQAPLALNAAAQLLLGGVGFALFAEQVVHAPLDDAGRLGFRLAGFTNATTALFTLWALRRLDAAALRTLAVFLAGYHVVAGADAFDGVAAGGALAAVGASAGPFHVGSACVLLVGVALSARAGR